MVSAARRIAWVTCAVALLLGWGGDHVAPRAPVTFGPYTVLAADFHVHGFPGDGALAPRDLAREAYRRGLDVFAVTNHNNRLAILLGAKGGVTEGALFIPGEELTSNGYHMAVIGVRETIPWRQSAADAARAVRRLGGVAIAAHPGTEGSPGLNDAALDALDGFEAAHPMMHITADLNRKLGAFRDRAIARNPSLARVGSSDFHVFSPIGKCRTFVFVRDVTESGVLEAIRAGRTVACDGEGRTYGEASLSDAVRERCRMSAGSPVVDGKGLPRAAAVALWLGLIGVVAAGAREAALE